MLESVLEDIVSVPRSLVGALDFFFFGGGGGVATALRGANTSETWGEDTRRCPWTP